jgi:hypothetical protein
MQEQYLLYEYGGIWQKRGRTYTNLGSYCLNLNKVRGHFGRTNVCILQQTKCREVATALL